MSASQRCFLPLPGPHERLTRTAAQIAALRLEVAGLRRALETRAPIEQAKGMLMMRYGCSEQAAFDILRQWSSLRNVKLRTVALTLVGIFTEDDAVVDPAVGPEALLHHVLHGSGLRAAPRARARTAP